jgi:hypothetical protein
MAQINVDLQGHSIQEGFELLSPGLYEAEVVDSEICNGPNGKYIKWTWQIIDKPNKVWDFMSIENDVSKSRLKTMAVCCKHPNPNFITNTDDFHGKRCLVKLIVKKDPNNEYPDQNRITSFKPLNGSQLSLSTQPQNSKDADPKLQQEQKMPWEA